MKNSAFEIKRLEDQSRLEIRVGSQPSIKQVRVRKVEGTNNGESIEIDGSSFS